jgi:hypothetical protein
METYQSKVPLHVAVQQVTNNTTAWIGHRFTDDADIIAGQTFTCPDEGDLGAIEIFSSLVMIPGHVNMTLHSFENDTKVWGPTLTSSSVVLDKVDNNKWISFPLNGLHLQKGNTYGFRLQSNDLYLGIGEAAGSHEHPPFTGGQEWVVNTENKNGKYFSYLSLTFKVDLRA